MKHLLLALLCGAALLGCGGSSNSVANAPAVPPPSGLGGLWEGLSVDDLSGNHPRLHVPTGHLYISIASAASNPIYLTFYGSSEHQNCLDRSSDNLTHIGNNGYRDSYNNVLTITASGNSLAVTFPDDELPLRFNMIKTNTSEADLQICGGAQNDEGSPPQHDQPGSSSLYEQLAAYWRRS